MKFKLAILASHPIQYQAPIFRELAKITDLTVFFAHRDTPEDQSAEGFGVAFRWDSDLESGYKNVYLKNRSRSPGFARFFGCNTPEIKRIIGQKRFDAVLVTGWNLYSYWQAIMACKRNNTPILVRGDSHLYTKRNVFVKILEWFLYRSMLQIFDRCLYVGRKSKEYFQFYGVPEQRLYFSPHSVDNSWFRNEIKKLDKNKTRLENGISTNGIVFAYVGKLVKNKRPGDVIDAVARIGMGCEIVYVGAGNQESNLLTRAQLLGVKIHLLGFRNQREMPACYLLADILVVPSESETWGLVVNEAMACGLHVVASTAVGSAVDLVEAGVTGYTYPVGDIEGLRKALEATIDCRSRSRFAYSPERKIREFTPTTTSLGILSACKSLGSEYGSPRQ